MLFSRLKYSISMLTIVAFITLVIFYNLLNEKDIYEVNSREDFSEKNDGNVAQNSNADKLRINILSKKESKIYANEVGPKNSLKISTETSEYELLEPDDSISYMEKANFFIKCIGLISRFEEREDLRYEVIQADLLADKLKGKYNRAGKGKYESIYDDCLSFADNKLDKATLNEEYNFSIDKAIALGNELAMFKKALMAARFDRDEDIEKLELLKIRQRAINVLTIFSDKGHRPSTQLLVNMYSNFDFPSTYNENKVYVLLSEKLGLKGESLENAMRFHVTYNL